MNASLWHSVRGYVKIQLKGLSLERLLNLARREGVALWDVRRCGTDRMTACLSVEDFRKLRFLRRSVRFSVHILERKGWAFAFSGLRRRPMLLLGGAAALCALWVCSLFVFEVRVSGCLKTDRQQIDASLAAQGVAPGVLRKDVDPAALSNRIVLDCPGVSWAGVTLEGGVLQVELIEEAEAPEFLSADEPADIVAKKDALLASLDVFEGRAAAKEGQRVLEGELLVEGIRRGSGATGELYAVHARAEALGRIWYTAKAQAGASVVEKQRTGRTQEALCVTIGSIEASPPPEFEEYDVERTVTFSAAGFYLPFSVTHEQRLEVAEQSARRTEEEMRRQAGEAAWVKAAQSIPKNARIVESTITYTRTQTGVEAVAVIETLEPIARSVPRAAANETP